MNSAPGNYYKTGIVIPALNEAKTIGAIIASAFAYGMPIVVDDGSTDNTFELASSSGASVVRHSVNRGYDGALNSGFERALYLGCKYIITVDADGQHDPAILASFINELDKGADVVIGIRDKRQRLAEEIFAWVGYRNFGIKDPLCGMKGYRMAVYEELGHFDSYQSIGTELAIYAASSGKKISQIDIKTLEREDHPRFGKIFSANRVILRALWLSLFPSAGKQKQ